MQALTIILTLLPLTLVAQKAPPTPITVEKGAAPGSLIIQCPFSKLTFSKDGGDPIDAANPMFTKSGSRLMNKVPITGDFNGRYVCVDLSGEQMSRIWQVEVPGTSSLSGGAIAGIVIAVLFAIFIIVAALWYAKSKNMFGDGDYGKGDEYDGADVQVDNEYQGSMSGRNGWTQPVTHNTRLVNNS